MGSNMKTAKLIALVWSFVFCSSLFCNGLAKASFPPDPPAQVEKASKLPPEVSGRPEVQTGQVGKDADSLKRATTKQAILSAFSLLFFSAFGLVLFGNLFRAPEGFENETGFHLRRGCTKPTGRARDSRRSWAHSLARRTPRLASSGLLKMLVSDKSF
jgi:hypothetical protein